MSEKYECKKCKKVIKGKELDDGRSEVFDIVIRCPKCGLSENVSSKD